MYLLLFFLTLILIFEVDQVEDLYGWNGYVDTCRKYLTPIINQFKPCVEKDAHDIMLDVNISFLTSNVFFYITIHILSELWYNKLGSRTNIRCTPQPDPSSAYIQYQFTEQSHYSKWV